MRVDDDVETFCLRWAAWGGRAGVGAGAVIKARLADHPGLVGVAFVFGVAEGVEEFCERVRRMAR